MLCRDYRNPNKKVWVEASIDEVLGNRTYLCKLLNENIVGNVMLIRFLIVS